MSRFLTLLKSGPPQSDKEWMSLRRKHLSLSLAAAGILGLFGPLAPIARAEDDKSLTLVKEELFPADLLQISTTSAFAKHVFLVDKNERKLIVYERNGQTVQKLSEIPADIGKNDGNKMKANDHRTPEGIYFFQKKLTSPEIPFNLYGKMAFTTDYPNLFDRHQKKTGSGIWLHSIPETVPLTRGSRGCIVIRNEALSQIESLIELHQTPVIIYDRVEYISKTEHDRRRIEMGEWIESWRKSWESMDVDQYLSNYDADFSAPGFANYKAWERHKRRLTKAYESIKVTLSQPFLLLHKDQLIIKTLQKYESDKHVDYGVKTIHALKTAKGYKILREEWVKANETGETTETGLISERPTSNDHHPN